MNWPALLALAAALAVVRWMWRWRTAATDHLVGLDLDHGPLPAGLSEVVQTWDDALEGLQTGAVWTVNADGKAGQ